MAVYLVLDRGNLAHALDKAGICGHHRAAGEAVDARAAGLAVDAGHAARYIVAHADIRLAVILLGQIGAQAHEQQIGHGDILFLAEFEQAFGGRGLKDECALADRQVVFFVVRPARAGGGMAGAADIGVERFARPFSLLFPERKEMCIRDSKWQMRSNAD